MKLFILLSLVVLCFGQKLYGGDFTTLDLTEALSDPIVLRCIDLGVAEVLRDGNSDGYIPDTDLTLSQVNSVETQIPKGNNKGVNYRIDVLLTNPGGAEVKSRFIINYQSTTDVVSWTDNFDFQYISYHN